MAPRQLADEVWHVGLMYRWVRGRSYLPVTVIDFYSHCIVQWELALFIQVQEVTEMIATALE
jgi:transposase InsO family protein